MNGETYCKEIAYFIEASGDRVFFDEPTIWTQLANVINDYANDACLFRLQTGFGIS